MYAQDGQTEEVFLDGGEMVKRAIYPGTLADGSPTVHLIEAGGYGLRQTGGLKIASADEHLPQVIELVESLQKKPGTVYILNSSLVAGEYTGFNARGDWFTEAGLRREPPGWDKIPVTDIGRRRQAALYAAEEVHHGGRSWGKVPWGYTTWMNAHRFQHHVNHSPSLAFGYVLGAFWDDRMKRVVLVSEVLEEECAKRGAIEVYRRIQRGEYPDTSMGCKVPFDRCSVCNHYARTPADYCRHVNNKDPFFRMKKLLDDGRRCGVYNDFPRGFDDSFVFRGAERAATVMADLTPRVGRRASIPYTRSVPGAGQATPAGERRASDFTPHLQYGSYGVAGNGIVTGGGGRLHQSDGMTPLARPHEHEEELLNQALQAVREESERVPGKSLSERLTRYLEGMPSGLAGEEENKRLLQRIHRLEQLHNGQISRSSYLDWEGEQRRLVEHAGSMLWGDLPLKQARLLQALKSHEREQGQIEAAHRLLAHSAERHKEHVRAEEASAAKAAAAPRLLQKRAEMVKRIPRPHPGTVARLDPLLRAQPDLPDHILQALAPILREAKEGLLSIGIILRPHEYARMYVLRAAERGLLPGAPPPCGCMDDSFPWAGGEDLEEAEDCLNASPWGVEETRTRGARLPGAFLHSLREALGGFSRSRSVLPSMIDLPRPTATPGILVRVVHSPILKEAAASYAEYRSAVLADSEAVGYLWREAEGFDGLPPKVGSATATLTSQAICRLA